MRMKRIIAALLCAGLTMECLAMSALAGELPEPIQTLPTQETAPVGVTVSFVLFDGEDILPDHIALPGDTITVPGYEQLYNDRVLEGWTSDPDGSIPEYLPGQTMTVTENAVYYAIWRSRRACQVYFQLDGMGTTSTVMEGDCVTNVPTPQDTDQGKFGGWWDEKGNLADPAMVPVWKDTTYTAVYLPSLTTEHIVYIHGYEEGGFGPGASLTRGEACAIFTQLMTSHMEHIPEQTFGDVPADAWYLSQLSELSAMGVIIGDDQGRIRPEDPITRAEFLTILAKFFPTEPAYSAFIDVPADHWAYDTISCAAVRGWVSGYEDGTFRPDAPITRAEGVSMLNRVLGRTGDPNVLEYRIERFFDVPLDHWAFGDIMEAATEHEYTVKDGQEQWTQYTEVKLTPGFRYVGGDLMYVSPETGWYVTDTTVDGFQFDSTGRYTSGNTELDGYVKAVLAQITTPEMSREQMLRAAYDYTRDSFTYLRRNYYEIGDTGWEMDEALVMFQTGYGNCYCYTAVFYYLSRQLGYDSTAISGVVGTDRDPHGWVEIDFNGVTHIFDTELEMAYRKKGVYSYDFYMMPYSRIPWAYVK